MRGTRASGCRVRRRGRERRQRVARRTRCARSSDTATDPCRRAARWRAAARGRCRRASARRRGRSGRSRVARELRSRAPRSRRRSSTGTSVLLRLGDAERAASGSCSTRRLLSGWMSQAIASASARTRARPAASAGSSGGCGCVSSSHSMIASDCVSTVAVVGDERGHEALRIDARGSRRARCAPLRRWTNVALRREALEVERDAHAVRGGRAEVVVELHRRSLSQERRMPVCARPRISAWTSCVPS